MAAAPPLSLARKIKFRYEDLSKRGDRISSVVNNLKLCGVKYTDLKMAMKYWWKNRKSNNKIHMEITELQ